METLLSTIPHTVEVIEKLRWNSHLGKHSHFEASKRGRDYHVFVGLPVVVINVLLGSLLFALVKETMPDWSKWAGGVLALIAAVLGAVQTFFNFKANYEGHRSVGNQYLSIARECERLLALHFDGKLPLDHLSEQIHKLNERYEKVNADAEKYMVKDEDYQKALKTQNEKAEKEPSLVQKVAANSKAANL